MQIENLIKIFTKVNNHKKSENSENSEKFILIPSFQFTLIDYLEDQNLLFSVL